MKKRVLYFTGLQLLIILFTLIVYRRLDLESYANMSFYIGGSITLFGLLTYVVAGGFFDFFTKSTRKVFTPKRMKEDVEQMRLPSEIFSFPYKPIIALGLSALLCMCIALFFYYS